MQDWGDFDGAITDYDKAIKIDPRYAPAYANRGAAKGHKGGSSGEIADYSRAIEINPRHALAYHNRGNAHLKKHDLEGAISDFNKAIEIDPDQAESCYERARARRAKGDLDGAIADGTQYISLNSRNPKYLADGYHNRGLARAAKGDLEGAILDYTKTIEIDRLSKDAYNELAWLLATGFKDSTRDGKKAVEFASRAAELTKWENAEVLDTLAAAYAETADFDEAIKWENKALSFPEFAKSSGEQARKRVRLYAERKPYHEPPPK